MNWHYNLNGARVGPVDRDKVASLYKNGVLTENTLVWNDTFGEEWRRIGALSEFRGGSSPPPLPSAAINDVWIWLIALVPIVGAFFEVVLSSNDVKAPNIFIVYGVANTILAFLDEKSIKNSGRKSPVSFVLALIIVPAYLFVRANRTGKSQITLIAWLASIVASIFVPQALSNVYLGLNMPSCSSSASAEQIKDLFPKLPVNTSHAVVFDIQNINTMQQTEIHQSCTATVLANDGKMHPIQYTIDSKDDRYYYFLQSIGF